MSRKINVEKAIDKIESVCVENNLSFLGFCDNDGNGCDWYGNETKLRLMCNACGYEWFKSSYNSFTVRCLGCRCCRSGKKYTNKKDFKGIVIEKCKEKNYKFFGFCDKDGNPLDEPLKAVTTYLNLKCDICGNEWKTTSYNGFVNCNQGCPKCKIEKVISQTRWAREELVDKIQQICEEKGYEFLGFCDENGCDCCLGKIKSTYLHLSCKKCNTEWKSSNIDSFIRCGSGCPTCKFVTIGEKKRLDSDYVLECILAKCEEKNITFLGFCDDNGCYCDYKVNTTKLHLKCNKCGHEWKSTSYGHFIERNVSCQFCSLWHLEDEIRKKCEKRNILYEHQKKIDWLGHLSLDFYLPQYNIAIECQGGQHFRSIDFYGGEKNFKGQLERDSRKQKLCLEHGIKLIYVVDSYRDVDWNIEIYTRENTIELSEFDSMIEKETENKML